MQDNENLQPFDNDILQCKADILKALGASKEQAAQTPPATPPQTPPVVQKPQEPLDDIVIETDFPEIELNESEKTDILPADSPGKTTAKPAEDIRILPFEALPKRSMPREEPVDVTFPEQTDRVEIEPEEEFSISDDEELLELSHVDSEEVHAENGILKTTLEQLRKHHNHERAEKERALDQLRAVSEAVEPLRQANEQLQRRLSELTSQNEQTVRETNQIHQGLVRSLEQEKAAHAFALKTLQSVQTELQKTQKARDFLSESFSSVSQQNEHLQSQVELLTRRQAELEAKAAESVADTLRQKQAVDERVKTLEDASAGLNGTFLELQQQNAKITSERDALQKAMEALAAQLLELQQADQQWQRQTQQLQQHTAQQEENIRQLESENRLMQILQSQNQSLRQDLSETEAALSQKQAAIRDLEAQLKTVTEENASACMQLQQIKESGRALQDEELALRQEIEKLKSAQTRYRQDAEEETFELNHRIQALLGQMTKLENQIAQHPGQVLQIQEELTGEQEAARQLKAQLETFRASEVSLQGQLSASLEKIKTQDDRHEASLRAMEAEKTALLDEQHKLEGELVALKAQLENLTLQKPEVEHQERGRSQHADGRLEVLLEPEELSALMSQPDIADADDALGDCDLEDIEVQTHDTLPTAEKSTFSLADLIMSEHRRSVAARRQRIQPARGGGAPRGIQHVLEQYVKPAAEPHPAAKTAASRMWEDDLLTPFQRDLLQEVIQKDIEHLREKTISRSRSWL